MAQIAVDGDLESPKYVDKLVKVYTKESQEQWVLVHVEVQGYVDRRFEERMYMYNYRIFDRYHRRITAIVLLTDRDRNFHPTEYRADFMGTEIVYRFNSYKVIDQNEKVLEQSSNPFAFVILTALLALQKGKVTDAALFDLKMGLARRLLERKFRKSTIRGIFYFIRNYVVFANPENSLKFDRAIDSITQKSKNMGIVEMIRERERNALIEKYRGEGLQQGIEKGIEKGLDKKSVEVVRNLLAAKKFTISEIANFASVSEAFVKKVMASSLKKKK